MPKRERPGIILRKREDGFAIPVSAFDFEQWQALRVGTEFNAIPMTKRSNPQNRYYWLILSRVAKAKGWTQGVYRMHEEIKETIGLVHLYIGMDGTLRKDLDSTDFLNMPQEEFQPYFDMAMAVLAEKCGFDPLQALAEAA